MNIGKNKIIKISLCEYIRGFIVAVIILVEELQNAIHENNPFTGQVCAGITIEQEPINERTQSSS